MKKETKRKRRQPKDGAQTALAVIEKAIGGKLAEPRPKQKRA